MADLVLKGGRIVEPGGERHADIVVGEDGMILAVGPGLTADRVLDATGCVVTPGLVDVFTGCGEPGRDQVETIASASRAAALGGYTAIVLRPDSRNPTDSVAVLREIQALSRAALCEVACAGTVTLRGAGEQLAPLGEFAAAGVRLVSDEGAGIQDARLLRRALEYAGELGLVVCQPAQEQRLGARGCAHEGAWSSLLGLAGVPAEAEELAVMRDLVVARQTGARLHLRRLSTGASMAMVAAARAGGVAVTADATVHHALLTDGAVAGVLPSLFDATAAGTDEVVATALRGGRAYDPDMRFDPPLRPEPDRAAVVDGFANGVLDALVSDHTPCAATDKELPFDLAAPGACGLETTLALALTLGLPLERLVALLSWQPAALAGLGATQGGPIREGRIANLAVIDADAEWTIDRSFFASQCSNTPWHGVAVRGRVRHTVSRGEAVVIDGEATR